MWKILFIFVILFEWKSLCSVQDKSMSSTPPNAKKPRLTSIQDMNQFVILSSKELEDFKSVFREMEEELKKKEQEMEKMRIYKDRTVQMWNELCSSRKMSIPLLSPLPFKLRCRVYDHLPLQTMANVIQMDEEIFEYFKENPLIVDKICVRISIVPLSERGQDVRVDIGIEIDDAHHGVHKEIHRISSKVFFDNRDVGCPFMTSSKFVDEYSKEMCRLNSQIDVKYDYVVEKDWSTILKLLQVLKVDTVTLQVGYHYRLHDHLDLFGRMKWSPNWLHLVWVNHFGLPDSQQLLSYHYDTLKKWSIYCSPVGIKLHSECRESEVFRQDEICYARRLCLSGVFGGDSFLSYTRANEAKISSPNISPYHLKDYFFFRTMIWLGAPCEMDIRMPMSNLEGSYLQSLMKSVRDDLTSNCPEFIFVPACKLDEKTLKCTIDKEEKSFAIRNEKAMKALFYHNCSLISVANYEQIHWPEQ